MQKWSGKIRYHIKNLTDNSTAANISDRRRNSKELKKNDLPIKMKNKVGPTSSTIYFEFLHLSEKLLPVRGLSPVKFLLTPIFPVNEECYEEDDNIICYINTTSLFIIHSLSL